MLAARIITGVVFGAAITGAILFAPSPVTAAVLAVPVIYIVMQRWLDDFANRIEVGPIVLIGAGTLALLLAMITVGLQSMKAAAADPVKSLRTE